MIGYCVDLPAVLIRPMLAPPINHSAPSGPATMELVPLNGERVNGSLLRTNGREPEDEEHSAA